MEMMVCICRVPPVSERPKQRVLEAFLQDPAEPQYGYDLMRKARVESGTLYPLLARMERQGMLTVGWKATTPGRPPRKYYQLTGDGVAATRLELAALRQKPASRMPARPAFGGSES